MVSLQHLSGGVHTDPLPGSHVPGHLQAHIQIVPYNRGLSAAVWLLRQLTDLFHQVLFRVLFQLKFQNFLAVDLNLIVLVLLPQLVLQHPDLRPQNLVPLGADQLVPYLALHLVLKAQHVALPGQKAVELPQPHIGNQLLKDLLLVGVAQVDVLGDEVRQIPGILAVHHLGNDLLRQAVHQPRVLAKEITGLTQQRLHPGPSPNRGGFLNKLHICLEIGLRLPQPAQPRPLPPLHHAAHGVG